MQRPPALPLSPVVSGFRTPLHRFGIVSRAAQTLGITYADSFKTAFDDLGATSRALAAARGPAELVAVQAAYLNRAGARHGPLRRGRRHDPRPHRRISAAEGSARRRAPSRIGADVSRWRMISEADKCAQASGEVGSPSVD